MIISRPVVLVVVVLVVVMTRFGGDGPGRVNDVRLMPGPSRTKEPSEPRKLLVAAV